MQNICTLIFLFMISWNTGLSATVRILTFHFNKPEFIELQYKTLSKFLQDDFEMIVFNDAAQETHEIAIQDMCDKYNIKCVRFEPEWHFTDPLNDRLKEQLDDCNVYSHVGFHSHSLYHIGSQPSIRHCHVIQYALDHYGYFHDDIVVIMDGDAFPIRPFSLKSELSTKDIVGIKRLISHENIDYLWVVFIAFDPRKLPNVWEFECHADVIEGKLHDTGAHTYHYLKNYPQINVEKCLGESSTCFKKFNANELTLRGYSDNEIWLIKKLPWPQCVEFHMNHQILHFGASSFELEGHDMKTECVSRFIDKILAE